MFQVVCCAPSYSGCGPFFPAPPTYRVGPVFPGPPAGPVFPGYPVFPGFPGYEEGCCPGPIVEQKTVVERPVTIPYSFSEPTYSKQCFQRGTVSREVIPGSFESAPVCETLEQTTKLPTTDITTFEQPLSKTTCTTSEYVIQIPIVETTCTSSPLCRKSVRTQDNIITTVSKATGCAKQVCTQNKVIEQPISETVCQNYQGAITTSGAQTVLKPEVVSSTVQLPPYNCLKPAGPVVFEGGFGGYSGGVGVVGGAGYYGGYTGLPGYSTGVGIVEVGAPGVVGAVGSAGYGLGYGCGLGGIVEVAGPPTYFPSPAPGPNCYCTA